MFWPPVSRRLPLNSAKQQAKLLAWVIVTCGAGFAASAAQAVPASPSGGCPQPLNALVITEFSIGSAEVPRWVEIVNPGKFTLSLAKVHLLVEATGAGKGPTKDNAIQQFDLGAILQELPAGEMVAVGFVPASGNIANVLLKTKIAALSADFVLPCAAKVSLEGPNGLVDDVAWDLCGSKTNKGVWNLDPSQTDSCKNDTMQVWCQPGGDLVGFGTPGKPNVACDLDADGYPSVSGNGAQADCNDMNKQVFPGALEVCNGVDDDCNGQTDEDLKAPPGTCMTKGWCAEDPGPGKAVAQCDGAGGFQCHYKAGYESVTETQCDLVDNDCDGLTDEGLTNPCGKCGAVPTEACNSLDDDCDGITDNVASLSQDCTGTGVCGAAKPVCDNGKASCAKPLAWEATETRCDNLDNDCDGDTDEDLGLSTACTKGTGACTGTGIRQCGPDDKVVCTAQERKPSEELCGDALDNNCDGYTDEKFNVGQQCEAGKGVCRVVGKVVCSTDKKADACNVKPISVVSAEICANTLDDNCDGHTDEASCTESASAALNTCSAGRSGSPIVLLAYLALIAAGLWLPRRRAVKVAG